MNEIWNCKDLNPPANCTFKATNLTFDIAKFKNTLNTTVEKLENQEGDTFAAEAATLSRAIYRMKQKFRRDKGFQALQKINSCLKRYLHVNITSTLNSFNSAIVINSPNSIILPTKNLLDFILARIQGLSKLCTRIIKSSRDVGVYMENKIAIGHFWKVALIALGIAARMSIFARLICETCIEIYQYLLGLRNDFKNIGNDWLPVNYEFPLNLKNWCGLDLDSDECLKIDDCKFVRDYIDLTVSSNKTPVGEDDKLIEGVDLESTVEEDVGMAVEVREVVKLNKNQLKKLKKRQKANVKNPKNIQSPEIVINNFTRLSQVKEFVENENNQRLVNKQTSVFKKVDDVKWKKVLKFIKKHVKLDSEGSLEKVKNILRAALKE